MARSKRLIVASLVLLLAGGAAANNMLAGPSPGLTVSGGSLTAQATPAPATPSTVGPSTGSSSPTTTPGTTTTTPSTTPSTSPTTTTPTTSVPPTTGSTPAVEQIVSLTRSVGPGTPVAAFTVPAGRALIVTDVFVTNPGTAPSCGASIGPSAATAPPAAAESGTGLLCVPPQSSLNLGLTTGLEFAAGQSVVLANTTDAAGAATPLLYHLRGFLVTPGS
jgi:hypothetical protein